MGARLRRVVGIPIIALGLTVAGCGQAVDGVAQPASVATAKPSSAVVAESTDCDHLTEVLGSLVSDRPYLTEGVLPGSADPTCSWSKGQANVLSTLTASVKPQVTDPVVIVEMRNGTNVIPDPRATAVNGVVLDVVAMALLTPTHSIIVNAIDPSVSDETKLDVAFAIAKYLQD
ncbi:MULTISPECIES: hypothetical protein [Rhodococcus]|uniref:hypothetical protein n=1 Tax=Rhodococcus TaxID=1827 RepID=UPI00194E65CC|nr:MULTISPECIES: hypothetical protein [Rhodococcus]QTJ68417.1 hypothetical protein HYG77_24460 [Rhodococcus sp. ZPP]